MEVPINRRLLPLTILIALTAVLLTPAGSAAAERQSGTWQGQVVSHQRHFDYEGIACDVDAPICSLAIVRFRIVPVTPQVRDALAEVAGESAQPTGTLVSNRGDPKHAGTLFVREVSSV